jgi:hypothetical protein
MGAGHEGWAGGGGGGWRMQGRSCRLAGACKAQVRRVPARCPPEARNRHHHSNFLPRGAASLGGEACDREQPSAHHRGPPTAHCGPGRPAAEGRRRGRRIKMVKAYLRYEPSGAFGVITSGVSPVYDASGAHIVTAALERVSVWSIKQGSLVRLQRLRLHWPRGSGSPAEPPPAPARRVANRPAWTAWHDNTPPRGHPPPHPPAQPPRHPPLPPGRSSPWPLSPARRGRGGRSRPPR